MKYLLLAYGDEPQLDAMSPNEREDFKARCQINDKMLCENGHIIAKEYVQSQHAAMLVQVRNGEVLLTARALTNGNEPLVGIFVLHARDLNDALRVATQMPQAHWGTLELWPIVEPASAVSQGIN